MIISKTEGLLLSIIIVLLIYIFYIKIYEYYSSKDIKLQSLKDKITNVFDNFKKIKVYKSTSTSYTINKKKIYMCLKDKEGNYYDDNTLIYVLLHEYSHTLCTDIGHTEQFDKIFKEVLQKAIHYGIYDGSEPKSDYCEYKQQ